MITAARFVNASSASCTFNDAYLPFSSFTTEVDIRFTERERIMQHGIWGGPTKLGKRLFHVEGDLLENTAANYWTKRLEMITAVYPRADLDYQTVGTLYLTLSGITGELSADCTLDGWPELPLQALYPTSSKYQINWKAFDPRLYAATQTSAVGSSYVSIVNGGNAEMAPIITFTGPAASLEIYHSVYGSLALTGLSLPAGGLLVVDMKNKTAVQNGTLNVYDNITDYNWWSLQPGNNTIRSVVTAGASASIAWQNAYMI